MTDLPPPDRFDFFKKHLHHHFHHIDWRRYRPLLVMIAVVFVASLALKIEALLSWFWVSVSGNAEGDPNMSLSVFIRDFMHAFMGLMFLMFAMFKLFDLDGFIEGFKKYDLFAQSSDRYARAYPFIEMFLGFAYLSYFIPPLTYALTMIIMTISGFSVIKAVINGMDERCACLGTLLNVPLSTVSIIENVGMGLMAALMLVG